MSLELSYDLYEKIKYFIPRLLLPGLEWGDIVVATESMNIPFSDEIFFWKLWMNSWIRQAKKYLFLFKNCTYQDIFYRQMKKLTCRVSF